MNTIAIVVLVGVFVTGYVAGLITGARLVHRKLAREVAVQVRDVKTSLGRFNRGPWVVTAAAFILVAIGVQAGISAQQHARDADRITALTVCVATYENQLSGSLPPVRKASNRNDDADIKFKRAVLALFAPDADKKTAAALKRALLHNIAVYEHLILVRKSNPYPTPPKKVCPHE